MSLTFRILGLTALLLAACSPTPVPPKDKEEMPPPPKELPVAGQPGLLDSSFGSKGRVAVGGVDVLAESDGVIAVLDANFKVTRLSKFGAVLAQSAAVSGGKASALARQTDGKLIVVGQIDNRMAAVRYLPDLTLDSSFGQNGVVKLKLGRDTAPESTFSASEARDVLVQPDGKIVLGGFAKQSDSDLVLVRLQSSGMPDPGFGQDGVALNDLKFTFAPSNPPLFLDDDISGLALQADGKIVAVGRSSTGSSYVAVLARYLPNGQLDSSFSGDGIVKAGSTGYSFFLTVAVQPDGQIIAGGTDARFSTLAFLQKFTPDGTGGAAANFKLNNAENSVYYDSVVRSLALQNNGDVIVGGYASELLDPGSSARSNNTYLARFSSSLIQDTAFGGTADGNVLIGPGSIVSVINSAENRLVATTARAIEDRDGQISVEAQGTVRFFR